MDVFFVISGFLITSLILKDLDRNEFSFLDFWERRARRILPASLFMTVAVMFMAYAVLMPRELVKVSEIAVAHALFLTNVCILFKNSGSYSQKPCICNP